MVTSDIVPFDAKRYPIDNKKNLRIGIVLSEWNHGIIERLKSNCVRRFKELSVADTQLTFFSVPGSFELPWGAKQFLTKGGFDGIICFGCVIQGETKHDDYLNHAVAKAIMTINLASHVPIVLGVLTTNTLDQAKERSGGTKGNKGAECAEAIIKMISASHELKSRKTKIGF
ncbi:MAG: 6,7-dimethyl-8-ribityllumazine synthase [Saprospiraceae bacterium]